MQDVDIKGSGGVGSGDAAQLGSVCLSHHVCNPSTLGLAVKTMKFQAHLGYKILSEVGGWQVWTTDTREGLLEPVVRHASLGSGVHNLGVNIISWASASASPCVSAVGVWGWGSGWLSSSLPQGEALTTTAQASRCPSSGVHRRMCGAHCGCHLHLQLPAQGALCRPGRPGPHLCLDGEWWRTGEGGVRFPLGHPGHCPPLRYGGDGAHPPRLCGMMDEEPLPL